MDAEIQRFRLRVEEEIRRYREAVGPLYHHGHPKYAEERMAEIRRHFDSERNRTLRNQERIEQELLVKLQRERELAGQFAADSVLTPSERSSAAERLPLIEADVASLDDVELAARLEGVLANGSKVEQFCYWRAAGKRSRVETKRRLSEGGNAPAHYRGSPEARVSPFDSALDRLEASLIGPERARREEEVAERAEQIQAILERAYLFRHDAGDLATAYSKQAHPAFYELAARSPKEPNGSGRIAADQIVAD